MEDKGENKAQSSNPNVLKNMSPLPFSPNYSTNGTPSTRKLRQQPPLPRPSSFIVRTSHFAPHSTLLRKNPIFKNRKQIYCPFSALSKKQSRLKRLILVRFLKRMRFCNGYRCCATVLIYFLILKSNFH